jgi:hypothetical protein
MTRSPADLTGPFGPLVAALDVLLGIDLPAAHDLGPRPSAGSFDQVELALLLGGAFQRASSDCLTLFEDAGSRASIWFESGRPIDVAMASTSADERARATAADAERWFLTVASWTTGRFSWGESVASTDAHRTHCLRHPAALVHESLRRRDVVSLRRWLGSGHNHPRLHHQPGTDDLIEAALGDETLSGAARLLDGTRSFADVVAGGQVDEESLLRAAFVLFAFGALDFAADAPAAPIDEPPRVAGQVDRARLSALHALAEHSDYFAFLGIDRTASTWEVASAIARISAEIRDQALDPDVALATGRERAVISEVLDEAKRILGDDGLRARYRAALPARPRDAIDGTARAVIAGESATVSPEQ